MLNANERRHVFACLPFFFALCILKDSSIWIDVQYCKCSKIWTTFLFLFSSEMLVIRAEIPKTLVSIVNREDPGQTASSEAV